MKPLLCFLGGCEFEYIIHELKSSPADYFDFDYFYSYQHKGQTNPYKYLVDNSHEILNLEPNAVILSQHDAMVPSREIENSEIYEFDLNQQEIKPSLLWLNCQQYQQENETVAII